MHKHVVAEGSDPRFARAQAGCRESLDALMRAHDGLVQAAVRRQVTGSAPFLDLLQAGREGLWRAILGYDPQHGARFATYAWPCIVRAIWRAARRPTPHRARLPAPHLPASDPAQLYLIAQVHTELHALVARLPLRLHTVIVQRYGLEGQAPATWLQIGAQLGLSGERARQLHQEALLWLQHPAHAQHLRSLLGRHTLAEYLAAAAGQARWRARRRGRHG
jgi:RNA polymerase sigma factor (sigma-70 family)